MASPQQSLHFSLTIQERFADFHARHPEVYAAIVRFAREVQSRGHHKFGIAFIWERARWYLAIEKSEDYKLNNNYRSRYARLVMEREQDLDGFFDTRELRAD